MISDLTNLIKNILKSNQRYILNNEIKIDIGYNYASGWRILIPAYSDIAIFSTVICNMPQKEEDRKVEIVSNYEILLNDPMLNKLIDKTKEIDRRYVLMKGNKDRREELGKIIGVANPTVDYLGTRDYLELDNFTGICYLVLFELYFNSPIEFIKGIDFYE